MQVESQDAVTSVESNIERYILNVPKPGFEDLRSDSTRIIETLRMTHQKLCQYIDIEVLRDISATLRKNNWYIEAVTRNDEVISLIPIGSRKLGLAVDAGTTKIAGYLVNLENGMTLASKGVMNPQISYGEDITSRIHHALKSREEALTLQRVIIEAINKMAEELCAEVGANVKEIADASIVGNTAIHHLLSGLPVYPLAYPPFNASVQEALDIKARDMGLRFAPGAYVHIMPNIAGFVGADHIAMLSAVNALSYDKLTLAIDIGTNTEVSLINKSEIFSASCASGPAFEGGHIHLRYKRRPMEL